MTREKAIGGNSVEVEPATVDGMEDTPHQIYNRSSFQAADSASVQHSWSNHALMPTVEGRVEC